MSYTLLFQSVDTIAVSSSLLSGATSCTITNGNFGSPTGVQLYVVDYGIPGTAEIISATISGTAVTGITRGLAGGAAATTNHAAGATIASIFVPQHYAALADGSGWGVNAITLAAPVTVTNQTGITTSVAITGLTTTITVPTGWVRYVRVTIIAEVLSTVSGDSVAIVINRDGTAEHESLIPIPVSSLGYTLINFFEEIPTAGSHTYTANVRRSTGSGSVSVQTATMFVDAY